MVVQSELVVARLADAARIAESAHPAGAWPGQAISGLEDVKLSTLLCILLDREWDDDALDGFECRHQVSDQGPWAIVCPEELVHGLARLDAAAAAATAAEWARTEEMEGWDVADATSAVNLMADLARRAANEAARLFLWISL